VTNKPSPVLLHVTNKPSLVLLHVTNKRTQFTILCKKV
jgi:hypothetical protein